ncbi:DNA primase [Candidatus Bathyarchaeota archaeon]|nr:DNA primase [Candidatus Bathyarchaeota archaeon]
MGPSQTVAVKYIISFNFDIEGVVEKPDVIGAVFGQTEGLFGSELDLRELQKLGRIGRIELKLQSKQDKTTGTLTIPTSLDRVSAAIIAASLESIDRVGPCSANVTLEKIEDVRNARRKAIVERSKEILRNWTLKVMPDTEEIFKEVSETLRLARVETYGPEKLSAGPDVKTAKKIIIVEGRADVTNLLKRGIQNVIAVEGTSIPQSVIKLSREKEVTAFLDGDRGGDLILKGLNQVANIKYVARAPSGKEVEDLSSEEITVALQKRVLVKKRKRPPAPKRQRKGKILLPKQIVSSVKELKGTLEAVLLNNKMKEIERLPVSKLAESLQGVEDVDTVVFDGVITQRLVDIASEKNIRYLVASRVSNVIKKPLQIHTFTFADVEG